MQALARSEALFREAYENAPIGIALVSPRRRVAACKSVVVRSCWVILSDELTRTTFQAITHPEDLENPICVLVRQGAGSGDPHLSDGEALPAPDGSRRCGRC